MRLKFLLLFLGFLASTARADLVLTNFGQPKFIKVMAIGDSITDDCSVNGAWRQYLQPLLEGNGYPYIAVGRQSSTAIPPSFTKINHEGYCGAVIAAPGVFAVHGYNTTDAYLLKIVADALTNANTRPDLVLLVIGTNDIGRGRDPYHVATNDMAGLLDLILTNVSKANVILSKITSLQSANAAGLNYAAYSTNVPIYNAALQMLVNQRRAAGQNVFLADMFSAVDYNTGFNTDHIHPNSVGLRAMANEFFARIQALTIRTNLYTATLVHGGDSWKFSDAGLDPGTSWAQPGYDDSGWSAGLARFGYGDPSVVTTVGYGPDPNNKYTTTYFRHPFVVPWNLGLTNLNVRLARADGAAVWLNGRELFRTNLPSGPLTYMDIAATTMAGFTPEIFYSTNLPVSGLPVGTNLVAVEVHLHSPTNSVLGFDLEMIGSGYRYSAPRLGITNAGGKFVLSWPVTNGNTFSLYSTTNLTSVSDWSAVPVTVETNGAQIIITQALDSEARFFQLRQP